MIFFFILIIACCVYSLESLRWGDSNEKTKYTFMLKKIENYSYYATWPGAIINPHCLELHVLLSPTNFHGPIGVPAIEFRLYMRKANGVRHTYHIFWTQIKFSVQMASNLCLLSSNLIDVIYVISLPSLSRLRLSRITAYLEEKIWSLF